MTLIKERKQKSNEQKRKILAPTISVTSDLPEHDYHFQTSL